MYSNNLLWGKSIPKKIPCERDDKRLVVTNSGCEAWCYPLSQSLPPFTSHLYIVSLSLSPSLYLSIRISLLVRVSSRLFLYCPPRCRLTEPCLTLPCLPFMDLTASKSTSPYLTILCDATLSHSLDLLGFYQPCRISSWDMTTCTTSPLPSHVTIPLGMHSET